MPWLGDGTWVQDYGLAKSIIHGRTKYRPWSGKVESERKERKDAVDTSDSDNDDDKRLSDNGDVHLS